MYNPSRGGVRGGADQFTWESVKGDKHRENYLGHSLMAPVGRWQKGKDLSWYARQRKDAEASESVENSEFASIKKAEEEAMLIALGHNIVRKNQTLTKEDMREALKRNTERDDYHIERIDGVGATSQRIASLSGVRKGAKQNDEGVSFETVRERNVSEINNDSRSESMIEEKKKNKKKSKKQKKHKKHHKESPDPGSSDDSSKYKTKHKKSKSEDTNKFKNIHTKYRSDSFDSADGKSSKLRDHKISKSKDRDFTNSGSSDDKERKFLKKKSHKKSKMRHQEYSSDSDSDSPAGVVQYKTKYKKRQSDSDDKKSSKEKSHKKSKHKDYSSDNCEEKHQKRHKKHKESVKRRRHDTSDSD